MALPKKAARGPINTLRDLQEGITHGGEHAFRLVPKLLKTLIERKVWAQCLDKDGNPFTSFESFVAYPLWWGLNSTIDELRTFCLKNEKVRGLIDGEIGALSKPGGARVQGDIVTLNTTRGNNPTYALVSGKSVKMCERAVGSKPPVAGAEPVAPKGD